MAKIIGEQGISYTDTGLLGNMWNAFPDLQIKRTGSKMVAGAAGPTVCRDLCSQAGATGANYVKLEQANECYCIDGDDNSQDWCFQKPVQSTNVISFINPDKHVPFGCPTDAYLGCANKTVDNEYLNLINPDATGFVPKSQAECWKFCEHQGSLGFVYNANALGDANACVGCIIPEWLNNTSAGGKFPSDAGRQNCLQEAPKSCSSRETILFPDTYAKSEITCNTECDPKPPLGHCLCDCSYSIDDHGNMKQWMCNRVSKGKNFCHGAAVPVCEAASTETALGAAGNVKGCYWDFTGGLPAAKLNAAYSEAHCQCTCALPVDDFMSYTDACSAISDPTQSGCPTKPYYPHGVCLTPGTQAADA